MRIVGGKKRGVTLIAPQGQATRPTTDRAREALFNILAGPRYRDRVEDRRIADFFAGSGAVGLEALSRGAATCRFLEQDRMALHALKQNIAKLGAEPSAHILAVNATTPPPTEDEVGFLFLDPPYRDAIALQTILAAEAAGWLADDALCVLQQHPKAPFSAPYGFEIAEDRRYGATRFLFLERA